MNSRLGSCYLEVTFIELETTFTAGLSHRTLLSNCGREHATYRRGMSSREPGGCLTGSSQAAVRQLNRGALLPFKWHSRKFGQCEARLRTRNEKKYRRLR